MLLLLLLLLLLLAVAVAVVVVVVVPAMVTPSVARAIRPGLLPPGRSP
ncbi:hypothetical protein K7B06_01145 [Streptomyces erythrochromogenes]|nr:hypothetical protein [Streptomyces erythrochromogenes]